MPLHILLIEDDDVLGASIETVLSMETNATVERITDGAHAMERLNGDPTDLVLLDLHLPHVSGLDILERLRAEPAWANCFIVVMTADVIRAKSIGIQADEVLIKPIMLDQLEEILARFGSGS